MKKQVRITEYRYSTTFQCEPKFNKYFIGILSMHTFLLLPSLTAGIYWPPSTAKVVHIPKFLIDGLHTWYLNTYKNVTNRSERNNFILN